MYKIYESLDAFYNWQGVDLTPAEGTVNAELGYPRGLTLRYTYPNPSDSATFEKDDQGMPINIQGADLRVCCFIDDKCPENLVPIGLLTKDQVLAEGFLNPEPTP